MRSDTPRFLADVMLQRLGRWLRAAGYDTQILTHAQDDYYLLRQAIDNDRTLLSCDQTVLTHRRADDHVIQLNSQRLEDWVDSLSQRLHIDWQYRPFTRCLSCNSLLQDPADDATNRSAPSVQQQTRYCAQCQQVYWQGQQAKRMGRQLAQWQRAGARTPRA